MYLKGATGVAARTSFGPFVKPQHVCHVKAESSFSDVRLWLANSVNAQKTAVVSKRCWIIKLALYGSFHTFCTTLPHRRFAQKYMFSKMPDEQLLARFPLHPYPLRFLLLTRHQLLDPGWISVFVTSKQSDESSGGYQSGCSSESSLVLRRVLLRPDVRAVHGSQVT